jgi:hypothetical protein
MESKILFLIDTTGSMENYIRSLRPSILQLSHLIQLLGTNTKIAILGYKDQSDKYPIIWSKWLDPCNPLFNDFINHLIPEGGSNDFCETSKLAISIAIEECVNTKQSLVIHYTDAPPHSQSYYFGAYSRKCGNDLKEKATLSRLGYSYDWIDICNKVHEMNLSIITIYSKNSIYEIVPNTVMAYYALLGQVIHLQDPTIQNITQTTIDIILSQFKGSVITSHMSFELKKTFKNEIELGEKDAIPILEAFEFYPKHKVFENFPNTSQLIKKFKENPEKITKVVNGKAINRTVAQPYRDLVYEILSDIMTTPEGIFSLTYNPVFGSLWRIVSAFSRIDERSVELANKLSREMGRLDQKQLTIVKEWLEESYNREDDVHEMIKSVKGFSDDSMVFILDMKEPVTKRQLMDVMRGTADNNSTGKVIRFLSTVQTVRYGDIPKYKKENMNYIPVDLASYKVMAIISHLIAPGIIMSDRPSAIISILTCLALEPSSELYKHASKHLEKESDTWIDVHKPELADNYSMSFINIINQLRNKEGSPEFLSKRESIFYDNLTTLVKITRNLNKYITVQIPYPTKNKQRQQFDHIIECKGCNKMRSFTVMHTEDQCGPCYLTSDQTTAPIVEKMKSFNASYNDTVNDLKNLPTQLSDKTNLFTCENCKCYYSIIDPTKLNVKPKCHFCRSGQVKKTSKCISCTNEFIDEAGLLENFNKKCGQCTYTNESFEDFKISIRDLFKKSPGLLELFGISELSVGYLSSNKSMYKACTSTPADVYFVPPIDEPTDPYFCSNAYHNQQLILQILKDEINEGATETECLLCYGTFPLNSLKPACGNCTHQLCEPCAKGWYSQNSPGNIVLETYSKCPFCKQLPKFDVIKNYNRILCQFNNRKHHFDPTCYEAWCQTCGIISEFAGKECANDIPVLNGQFKCSVCKIKEDRLDPSEFHKECPGCGVMTYKTGGCNHMTCIMDGCKTHWCWVCRWKSTPGSSGGIYEHLRKEHGGAYDFQQRNELGYNEGDYDSGDDDAYTDDGHY